MLNSRKITVLVALAASMTLGTVALSVMDRPPVRPPQPAAILGSEPGALAAVLRPRSPLQANKWQKIVLHASVGEHAPVALGCHLKVFVDGQRPIRVEPTSLWQDQADGRHVTLAGLGQNARSIGICLIGDDGRTALTAEQLKQLLDLVHRLQRRCEIPAGRVYLAEHLGLAGTTPGEAFPRARFDDALLR